MKRAIFNKCFRTRNNCASILILSTVLNSIKSFQINSDNLTTKNESNFSKGRNLNSNLNHLSTDHEDNYRDENNRPCFIVGDFIMPSFTSIETFRPVNCLFETSENILPEVPDLILNNIKYSSIDFFKHFSKSKESPISYSIQKFVLKDKKLKKYNFKSQKKIDFIDPHLKIYSETIDENNYNIDHKLDDFISNRTLISTYWYLYGAMDLSLRSLGDSNYKAKLFLNLLKGPGFVLNFQLARIDKDSKRLEESLSHALSNCAYCTGEEGLFLINLANQSGLNKTVTSKYLNRLTKHNDKVFSGVSNPFNLITFPTRIICCLSIFTFASFFL